MKAILAGFLTLLISASACAEAQRYEVTQRMPLGGGAQRWDFLAVDHDSGRLFVTRENQVDVVDLGSARVLASIKDLPRVHGVALAPAFNLGFISAGGANAIVVFDLGSLARRTTIPVTGKNQDALLFEPSVNQLYVFNHDSDSVDIVDVETLKITATLRASRHPEVAVSDGRGHIYFNIEDHAGIDVIDIATASISARWKLSDCDEPSGIDMDIKNRRLFSACSNHRVVVTHADTGQYVGHFKVGEGPDGIAFDAATATVLTSSGASGTLDVALQVSPNRYEVGASVVTLKGARTLVLDPISHKLYMPAVVDGVLTIVVARPAAY